MPRAAWIGATIILLLLVAAIGSRVLVGERTPRPIEFAFDPGLRSVYKDFADCIKQTTEATKTDAPNIDNYQKIWALCGNQIYDLLLYNDFLIRRQKYSDNTLDEKVNLWLVVVITLSGVVLAAFQLVLSYKLAVIAHTDLAASSELAAEQGKISFKSSVTGLMILALSLLFFVVYVKWIYQTNDINAQKPDNLRLQADQVRPPFARQLPPGSLGPASPPASGPAPKP